jgi:hypothetical protein
MAQGYIFRRNCAMDEDSDTDTVSSQHQLP